MFGLRVTAGTPAKLASYEDLGGWYSTETSTTKCLEESSIIILVFHKTLWMLILNIL